MEKVDFVMKVSPTHFLQRTTAGSESFEYTCGELSAVASGNFLSSRSLEELVDSLCNTTKFSMVELVEDVAASLYAVDWNSHPVCLLIKKGRHDEADQLNNYFDVHCKCADNEILASSIVQDVCDQSRRDT